MVFAQSGWLYLLPLTLLPVVWWWLRGRREGAWRYPQVDLLPAAGRSWRVRLRGLPAVLRSAVLALGLLALARPQWHHARVERFAEGVDILLVLDISTSMRAEDLKPNRFEAAREVAAAFVRGRVSDRVGLVVFAEQAYTQVPLTLDYDFLLRMLSGVQIGHISDGTAIGTALATAVNRLKDSRARSKVIILLTDGQNNRGAIDPETAAELAASLGIRVYTVGVGARGTAPYTVDSPFMGRVTRQVKVEIDEQMLRAVAEKTGGRYFRATDNEGLEAIYRDIGEMEKTKIQTRTFVDTEEAYPRFLWPAFLLFLAECLLSVTFFRRFP